MNKTFMCDQNPSDTNFLIVMMLLDIYKVSVESGML